jgi:hypothetical protein
MIGHRPTNDTPAVGVEHHGEIEKPRPVGEGQVEGCWRSVSEDFCK